MTYHSPDADPIAFKNRLATKEPQQPWPTLHLTKASGALIQRRLVRLLLLFAIGVSLVAVSLRLVSLSNDLPNGTHTIRLRPIESSPIDPHILLVVQCDSSTSYDRIDRYRSMYAPFFETIVFLSGRDQHGSTDATIMSNRRFTDLMQLYPQMSGYLIMSIDVVINPWAMPTQLDTMWLPSKRIEKAFVSDADINDDWSDVAQSECQQFWKNSRLPSRYVDDMWRIMGGQRRVCFKNWSGVFYIPNGYAVEAFNELYSILDTYQHLDTDIKVTTATRMMFEADEIGISYISMIEVAVEERTISNEIAAIAGYNGKFTRLKEWLDSSESSWNVAVQQHKVPIIDGEPLFKNILLIVQFNRPHYDVLGQYLARYRRFFPNVAVSGEAPFPNGFEEEHNVKTFVVPTENGQYQQRVMLTVVESLPGYDGYLQSNDDVLLNPYALASLSLRNLWQVQRYQWADNEPHSNMLRVSYVSDSAPSAIWWDSFGDPQGKSVQMFQHQLMQPRYKSAMRQILGPDRYVLFHIWHDFFFLPAAAIKEFSVLSQITLDVGKIHMEGGFSTITRMMFEADNIGVSKLNAPYLWGEPQRSLPYMKQLVSAGVDAMHAIKMANAAPETKAWIEDWFKEAREQWFSSFATNQRYPVRPAPLLTFGSDGLSWTVERSRSPYRDK